LIDAPHATRRHTLDSLLAQYGPKEQAACRASLIRATAKAAEASRLLDLHLPSAPVLESLVRSALSMDPQLADTVVLSPARSFAALERN
jgi:hypothetical protein